MSRETYQTSFVTGGDESDIVLVLRVKDKEGMGSLSSFIHCDATMLGGLSIAIQLTGLGSGHDSLHKKGKDEDSSGPPVLRAQIQFERRI